MLEKELEFYRTASKIAAEALEYASSLVKPGVKIIDISNRTEEFINSKGGDLAFPVQLSKNDIAAHYCSPPNDDTIINEEDIVKIDIGVHIHGYIGDNATTVYLGDDKVMLKLVRASREAVDNAIKIIKPGTTLSQIGAVIESTIHRHNFEPIRNLSGHGLERYEIHAGPSIPNYDTGNETVLEQGKVYAIEPFATNGTGLVGEAKNAEIFSLVKRKPVRSFFARQVLSEIDKLQGLPFCTRHLTKKIPLIKVNAALKEMNHLGMLRLYPPLIEKKRGLVSQAEHTIYLGDKIEVLTKKE
ncbi:type II methionyl aminopeptidase [Candidatus Woesearchaeota archaeon]|nr:MAG: type II methionyl aminopeptidase [Candidatus Woesearchaeota archaeon]